jgi:long-chain acyl-CoA synthetase
VTAHREISAASTVEGLLRVAAAKRPGAIVLVDGARRYTCAELDALVDRAARALLESGLAAGDRVVLQLGNSAEFVVLYLAAGRAGLVAVPTSPAHTPRELSFVVADSGARLLVTSSVDGLGISGVRVLTMSDVPGFMESAPVSGSGVALPTTSPDALAVLLYTSGTSGRPKGAMLSSAALVANLEQIAALDPPAVTAADTLFVPVPLCHVLGLNGGLGNALRSGATLVLADRFDTSETLATMAGEGVTVVAGVPGMFAAWAAHPDFARGFASVGLAWSGAAPLPAALVATYGAAGVPLCEGYGLTETAPVITVNFSPNGPKPGSVGRPLPGIDLELRDPDGALARPTDPGEVFVRGPNLFRGYWPDGTDGPSADGWFATGDIGYLDGDGALHLVGRSTDLVVVNGFNVYPSEVEAVLRAQGGVEEVAVVGVDDPSTGEAVIAYVVAAADAVLHPDELIAAASRSLARFKLPRQIEVVTELPRTVTGKVMKWRLQAAQLAKSADGVE